MLWPTSWRVSSLPSFLLVVRTLDQNADQFILPFHRLAGTVFLNRCDALDPALAWTGVKDSGRGVSLSEFGEFSAPLPFFPSFGFPRSPTSAGRS